MSEIIRDLGCRMISLILHSHSGKTIVMADRKKPKQKRSKEVVQSILTATSLVVEKEGVDGLTMEKVSQKAGVSPGSVYQYFSSKDAVIGGFVTNELSTEFNIIAENLIKWRDLPLRELTPKIIGFLAAYLEQNAQRMKHVFQMSGSTPELREQHMQLRRAIIALLTNVLESHRSEIRFENCHKAATTIVHALMGALTAQFFDEKLEFQPQEIQAEVTDMMARYIIVD